MATSNLQDELGANDDIFPPLSKVLLTKMIFRFSKGGICYVGFVEGMTDVLWLYS